MGRRIRKVVDSNYLNSDKFREYLAGSPEHYAVIPAAALIEILKGDALRTMTPSMVILSEFPHQVIILKADSIVARLTDPVSNPQLRLIDKMQTGEFPGFCKKFAAMKPLAVQEFLAEGRLVNDKFARMHSILEGSADLIPKAVEHYSAAERKMLNGGGPLTRPLMQKVSASILTLTDLKMDYIKTARMPRDHRLLDAFAFREALCTYIWLLSTLKGTPTTNPARIANSIMDVSFVAFATYFDDFLSNDHLALQIYGKASTWLRQLRGDGIPVLSG